MYLRAITLVQFYENIYLSKGEMMKNLEKVLLNMSAFNEDAKFEYESVIAVPSTDKNGRQFDKTLIG